MTAQNARSTEGIRRSTAARNAAVIALRTQVGEEILLQEAQLAGLISTGSVKDAFSQLPDLFKKVDAQYKATAISGGVLGKINTFLSASFAKLAIRIRLVGLAFLQALPLIGAIVAGLAALGAAAVFFRKLALEAAGLDKINEELNETTKKLVETTNENKEIIENIIATRKGEETSIKTQTQLSIANKTVLETQTAALQKQLEVLEKLGDRRLFGANEARKNAIRAILESAKLNETLEEQLKLRLQEEGVLFRSGKIMSVTQASLDKALNAYEDLFGNVNKATTAEGKFAESVKAANEPLRKLQGTMSQTTAYDDTVAALEDVNSKLKDLNKTATDDESLEARLKILAEAAAGSLGDSFPEALRDKLKEVRESGFDLAGMTTTEREEADEMNRKLSERIALQTELMEKAKDHILNTKRIVREHTHAAKKLEEINFSEEIGLKIAQRKNAATNKQLAQVDDDLKLRRLRTDEESKSEGFIARTKELEQQRVELVDQLISKQEISLEVAQSRLQGIQLEQKAMQSLIQLEATLAANKSATLALSEQSLRAAARTDSAAAGRGFVVTAEQEAEIAKELFDDRVAAAVREFNSRKQQIEMEYALLDAQLVVQREEMNVINAKHRQAVAEERIKKGTPIMMAGVGIQDLVDTTFLDKAIGTVNAARTAAFEQNATQTGQRLLALSQNLVEVEAKARTVAASRQENEALDRLKTEQEGQRALGDILAKQGASEKERLAARREQLEREARAASLDNPALNDSVITAEQRLSIEKQLEEERKTAIENEAVLRTLMINMEYDLLDAKLRAAKAEAVQRAKENPNIDENEVAKRFDKALGTVEGARESAIQAINTDASNRISKVYEEVADSARAASDKAAGRTRGTDGNTTSPMAGFMTQADSVQGLIDKESDTYTESLTTRAAGLSKLGLEIQNTFNAIGPDSPAMTAALEGALTISNAWEGAFDDIDTKAGFSLSLIHISEPTRPY